MDLIISNNSSSPLYEQLVEQIKHHILSDQLKPDELLPSIRMLAKELQISIITVKRAYEELESAGYVITIPGKGTYVSTTNKERLREARVNQIEEKLEEVVLASKAIDLQLEELIERLKLIYEEV